MLPEDLQGAGLPLQRNKGYAVFYPVSRYSITDFPQSRRMILHQSLQNSIRSIIDKNSTRLYLIYKNAKLVQVIFKCREDIDMIPGNPRYHGNMWKKKMEFGSFLQRTCRVFIPFTDNDGGMGDIDRLGETFQPRPDQPVKIHSGRCQRRHDHGRRSSLSMTAAHYYPLLVTALLVDI